MFYECNTTHILPKAPSDEKNFFPDFLKYFVSKSCLNDLMILSQLSHGFVSLHSWLFLHLISNTSSFKCFSNLAFLSLSNSSFWLIFSLCLASLSQDLLQNSFDLNQLFDWKVKKWYTLHHTSDINWPLILKYMYQMFTCIWHHVELWFESSSDFWNRLRQP